MKRVLRLPKSVIRTGIAAGVVLLLIGLLAFIRLKQPGSALLLPGAGATIRIVPNTGLVNVGEQVTVDVKLDTNNFAVAGVGVTLSYSSNLTFVSSDVTTSVFNTEVKPVSVANNVLSFVRVRTDTGFNGSSGQLARLVFNVNASGATFINIDLMTSEVIAYADSSNVLSAASNGSFTATYSLCMNIGFNNRAAGQYQMSGIQADVYTLSAVKVASVSNLVTGADGKLLINDAALASLSSGTPYQVMLKAPGYLSTVLETVQVGQCVAANPADFLRVGDFNNDNVVGLADLTTMIRSYNGVIDAGTQIVNNAYLGKPTLSKLVDLIRTLNTNPNGELPGKG
jgi:hypothetical protein